MTIILLCDSKTSTNYRAKKRKLCESVPKWRKVKPTYTKVHKRDSDHDACLKKMKESLKSLTPAEIFEKLITPEICDYLIMESVRYAMTCKNIMDMVLTFDE